MEQPLINVQFNHFVLSEDMTCTGTDPGFYVRGHTSWQWVWGWPRSPVGPGQHLVGGPGA